MIESPQSKMMVILSSLDSIPSELEKMIRELTDSITYLYTRLLISLSVVAIVTIAFHLTKSWVSFIKPRYPIQTPSTPSTSRNYKPLTNLFNVFHNDENNKSTILKKNLSPNKWKIKKYLKPKYIYHELMSIWGTTYTVITWGSVCIIGGALVASQRLASKIKTKCTREQQQDSLNGTRGTGRNSSSAFHNTSFSPSESLTSKGSSKSLSLNRVGSWVKRSCTATKKKFNKIGVATLQITQTVSDSSGDSVELLCESYTEDE